ncbi:MAG: tetratricopeptide repeat protein [bacterium]
MNPVVVVAPIGLALLAVATAGIVAPLAKREIPILEPDRDPFEDRRQSLLLALKDLVDARDRGDLDAGEYDRLRPLTEARLARILRIIDERSEDGSLRGRTVSSERTAMIPRWGAAVLVAAAIATAAVPALLRSAGARPEGSTFTGSLADPQPRNEDPLAFFTNRVLANPDDVAARLDLAHRYLDAGQTGKAIDQYLAALRLDPGNAEAHAHMGLLLFMTGRAEGGLKAVERALTIEPHYPEALFFKGVILLQGLNDRQGAAVALREYLRLAPFGSERNRAEELLAEAEKL